MTEEFFKIECKTLLNEFRGNHISTERFISQFVDLWHRYRKWRYAVKETWPEPYDKQLFAAASRNEISAEELHHKLVLLLGETTSFEEMLEFIHSALSLYNPEPTLDYELDEESLRAEVEKSIQKYGLGSLD